MKTILCFLVFHFLFTVATDIDYLKALDDFITYKILFKPQFEEELYHKENKDANNWVSMMSADDEEYRCLLPTVQIDTKKRIEAYSGPSPAELLHPLYLDDTCSYRYDGYWAYEYCPGRYILQFHAEKEKPRIDYYLGNFVKVQAEAEAAKFDQLNPPVRKVEEEELAYYPVTYSHGTTCDVTNKPRQTIVHHVCDEAFKGHIHSVTEVSSCQYEIIFKTNRLCAHPSFQSASNNEHDIHCFAVQGQSTSIPKPRALSASERESTRDFFKEFKGSSKNVFTRLLQSDDSSDGLEQLNMILEALKASTVTGAKATALLPPKSVAPPTSDEQKLLDEFWNGKACLTGGSGYWKYEICHGRTVVQYHKEFGKEERMNIVLGVFHKEVHKKWIDENPHKGRKSDEGRVYQVSNFYSQGDICPETGTYRNCEVRLRCQEESSSSSKILIYLLEPQTCSYTLVIESPLLCEDLKQADEYGILPGMPELNSFEAVEEAKKIPSKDHSNMIQIFKHENLADVTKPNPHISESSSYSSASLSSTDISENGAVPPAIEPPSTASDEEILDGAGKAKAPKAKRPLNDLFEELLFDEDAIVEMVQNLGDISGVVIKKEFRTLDDRDDKKNKEDDTREEEKSSKGKKLVYD